MPKPSAIHSLFQKSDEIILHAFSPKKEKGRHNGIFESIDDYTFGLLNIRMDKTQMHKNNRHVLKIGQK